MERFEGKKIFNGIAIGRILYFEKGECAAIKKNIENVEQELERFEAAKKTAKEQLKELYEKAVVEVGEVNAQIFEVHGFMIDDEDYNESVVNMISGQKVNAEYAVEKTGENFAQMFADMDDEYFKARSADVKDISDRLAGILCGREFSGQLSEPCIVAANDLAPSQTVQMDKSKLLAFVTKLGSANSHTAILARTMGIPALVNIDVSEKWHGKMGIIDGFEGILIVDPDEETLRIYNDKSEKEKERKALLEELKGKETVTKSGKKLLLYANIGNVSDLGAVLQNDAGGIGLFRSEFIYLGNSDYPTEEEQFEIYKQVAETMAGKKVIIRTLDIGADKTAMYFGLSREENPAMGYRAIRICLSEPWVFKTQLRAILRASAYGNIAVMYPMIISLDEIRQIHELMNEVKKELSDEKIPYKNIEQGIMIETPAAAVISDLLAKEVDFFSIGTNDLTQYTLAIDRQNNRLDKFYDPHHEAVMRLIKTVIDNAHREGIWAGVCGELGADTTLTEKFLKMGVDELSVSPAYILPIRKIVRESQ